MRLTTTIIDRALLVVVAAVALVSVLSVGVDLVQHGPLLRADPAVLVVTAAIVLAAVWTLVDFAVGRVRSRAAQAYTLGGLIGTPLILLPWAPSATTLSTPEVLLRLTWPAVICSAVLLRRGIRATVVFAVIIYLMRRPTVGSGAAALEATLYANGLLAAHLGISMVRSAARAVEDSSARIWLARTREARAQQVLLEREEWRSLIHDKVLGALQLVSRRPSPQRDQLAAGLAAEALADLRGRATGGDRDVGDRVASAAHRLGLSVDVDIDGACPQDFVADALADATEAALTNTAWHAGVTSAVVWARFTDDTAQVLVRDSGVGFEPRAVPADRLGISQGIVRRMAAVGGDATVVSTPGAGTSVTLRWQRPRVRIPSTEDSPGWSPRYRRLAVIIGTVMTLGHCLVGATRWWEYDPPAWVPFAIVSAVTLTVLTVFAPVRWRVVPIVAIAGTAVTMSLLTSTLIEPLIPDWRYWFVGAHYVLGATLALRWPRWALPAFIAAVTGALLFWVPLPVPRAAAFVTPLLIGMLIHLIPVVGIRYSLDSARRQVAARDEEEWLSSVRRAAVDERSARTAARLRSLNDAVMPTLSRLTFGAHHTPQFRAHCAQLETTTRDELLADLLLDDDLRHAIADARRRGVHVELTARSAHGARPALPGHVHARARPGRSGGAGAGPPPTRRVGAHRLGGPHPCGHRRPRHRRADRRRRRDAGDRGCHGAPHLRRPVQPVGARTGRSAQGRSSQGRSRRCGVLQKRDRQRRGAHGMVSPTHRAERRRFCEIDPRHSVRNSGGALAHRFRLSGIGRHYDERDSLARRPRRAARRVRHVCGGTG